MKDVIGIVTKQVGSVVVNGDIEIYHCVACPSEGYQLSATVSYFDNGRPRMPKYSIDPKKLTVFGVPNGVKLDWMVWSARTPDLI